jgi:hypothetical protein
VPLHLLRVVQSPLATGLTPYVINTGELLAAARADLDELAAEHRLRHPGVDVRVAVTFGSPSATLIEASRDADLVVVGCRGHGGFAELLLGSVSSQVAAHAHGPVLVARPAPEHADATWPVMVGIDGSAATPATLEFAFAEASARCVPLIAAYVWWAPFVEGVDPADSWAVDPVLAR